MSFVDFFRKKNKIEESTQRPDDLKFLKIEKNKQIPVTIYQESSLESTPENIELDNYFNDAISARKSTDWALWQENLERCEEFEGATCRVFSEWLTGYLAQLRMEECDELISKIPTCACLYEDLMVLGDRFFSSGASGQALNIYREALTLKNTIEAVDSMAKTLLVLSRAGEAKELLLSEADSNSPASYVTLLQCYIVLGEMDEARSILFKLTEDGKSTSEMFLVLAQVMTAKKDFADVINLLECAIDNDVGSEDLCLLMASAYEESGELDEAEYCFETALADYGDSKSVTHEYANFQFRNGFYESAKNKFLALLSESPEDVTLLNDLGGGLFACGYIEEALQYYKECIRLSPDSAMSLNNYSVALRETGRFEEAYATSLQALDIVESRSKEGLKNNISVDVITLNRAMIEFDLGKSRDIEKILTDRLKIKPDDHRVGWYRCLSRLVLGDLKGGWMDYQFRWEAEGVIKRPFDFECWQGETIKNNEKLLIFGEQGLGDEIMFASCLNEVPCDGGAIVLECDPKLEKIFRRSFANAQVVGSGRFDCPDWVNEFEGRVKQVAIGDLPKYFRLNQSDFYGKTPFLKADKLRIEYWTNELDKLGVEKKIGISWKGGAKKTRTILRSIDLEELLPILGLKDVTWINLQYGDVDEELQEFYEKHNVTIHHFQDAIDDYDETAALVMSLDCVISVQTAVVHLAGALGKDVHCLLPSAPEWRYRMGSDGSRKDRKMLWYSSVRLYTQEKTGDWSGAVERVRTSLLEDVRV